jgi:hypothetical protein
VNTPFVVRGNVFAVPVLRHHLTFAVQVRRAFEQLGPDRRDVVAVALPESVRAPTFRAVDGLPRVSLVVSTSGGTDPQEVFPVTPADGIVEAIRSARELGVPLRFVDQEVAAGNLLDRFCMADESWPEDELALEHGAEAHLAMIGGRLTHPPSRFEPMDSWRELHMAAQLQALVARYRQVLFVADATHILPVLRQLGRPVPRNEPVGAPLPAPRYHVSPPILPVLLGYLDSIPRLVEAYERERALGRAHEFNKRRALLEILHDLSEASPDQHLSIRHYQAFVQVLTRQLERYKLISPTLDTVIQASEGCFPPSFRERVFRHLLGYFDQVKTQRIGRLRDTREAVFSVTAAPARQGERVYVARNCTQFEQVYDVVRLDGEAAKDAPSAPVDLPPGMIIELDPPKTPPPGPWRRSGDWRRSYWPPADTFLTEMRGKAIRLGSRPLDPGVKSVEFRGSLLEGMDFRRTLRSYYTRQELRLYVKQRLPARNLSLGPHEPVMWLFDGYDTFDPRSPDFRFNIEEWGLADDPFLMDWHVERHQESREFTDRAGAPMLVDTLPLYGRVTFSGVGMTMEAFRAMPLDFQQRTPRPADVTDFWQVAAEMQDYYSTSFGLSRWWDLLLAWGLTRAQHTIVLVAPNQLVVPDAIVRRATADGKSIVRISTARFTAEELRRLQVHPALSHRYEQYLNVESEDPDYLRFLVRHFDDIMKSYW